MEFAVGKHGHQSVLLIELLQKNTQQNQVRKEIKKALQIREEIKEAIRVEKSLAKGVGDDCQKRSPELTADTLDPEIITEFSQWNIRLLCLNSVAARGENGREDC